MSDKCPKCGGDISCLGGCSAHHSNWYCDDEACCGWKAWETAKPESSPRSPGYPLPTLSQAIAWAHVRQHALQEIRTKYPDHPAALIAVKAMTIGPDSQGMASLANAAMEKE